MGMRNRAVKSALSRCVSFCAAPSSFRGRPQAGTRNRTMAGSCAEGLDPGFAADARLGMTKRGGPLSGAAELTGPSGISANFPAGFNLSLNRRFRCAFSWPLRPSSVLGAAPAVGGNPRFHHRESQRLRRRPVPRERGAVRQGGGERLLPVAQLFAGRLVPQGRAGRSYRQHRAGDLPRRDLRRLGRDRVHALS